MAQNKRKESLKISFLMVTIIPLFLMGVIIVSFASYKFTKAIETEVNKGMMNQAVVVEETLDRMYPGDYVLVKSEKYMALKKGDEFLVIQEYLECIKEETGLDVTIFYGDLRMITTLKDTEGNSLQGTGANSAISAEVLKQDNTKFCTSVKTGDTEYYAYYRPLHNSDGSVVGMIAVLKTKQEVKRLINESVYPIYIIDVVVMAIAGLINIMYSQKIIRYFNAIKKYLVAIEKDNYSVEMNYKLLERKDELGEMANAAVKMRRAIKKLTEVDALTGIYNRRYANKRLKNYIKISEDDVNYTLCIGDIDYFKEVNDTYGHDAGDTVLISIATELKNFMRNKGFVARWGGEEFMLVFENTSLEDTVKLLEELRERVARIKYNFKKDLVVTMSFGATLGDTDMEKTIKNADNKLYIAKTSGRNRVVGIEKK